MKFNFIGRGLDASRYQGQPITSSSKPSSPLPEGLSDIPVTNTETPSASTLPSSSATFSTDLLDLPNEIVMGELSEVQFHT